MKTAIYVEDGVTQLVLTPENKWEENVTKAIQDGEGAVRILRGEFYACRGGWIRQGEYAQAQSLILVVGIKAEPIT